jgi:type VI secretion system protein ImpA
MPFIDVDALLGHVDDDHPCGLNLEYDPAFLELEKEALGKPEVQYGETITPAVPPDWKVVRKIATELLTRSRDLRIIMPLARATMSLNGFAGLSESLTLIARLLEDQWESVHPQLDPDDDLDPMLRINSLATLCDSTFLSELRDITLIVLPGLGRLTIRDLQIATGDLPEGDGHPKLAMSSIEAACRDVDKEIFGATAQAVADACAAVRRIETILVSKVGTSQALNLDPLTRLLDNGRQVMSVQTNKPVHGTEADSSMPAARRDGGVSGGAIADQITNRDDVLRMLDKICGYYQRNEPSSPVPLLLERAKRLVTKNFLEILEDMTPDGVSQLEVISGVRRERDQ